MTCIKTSGKRDEFVRSVKKLIPEHEDRITKLVKAVQTEEDLWYNNSREMMWAFNNPLFHDVVFVVGDGDGDGENVRRIPAHKVVLCARSPYFKAMLTGGMKVCLVSLRFVIAVRLQNHIELLATTTQRNRKKGRYILMIPMLKHS